MQGVRDSSRRSRPRCPRSPEVGPDRRHRRHDHRHRRADEPARAQRGDRGGTRRRAGSGFAVVAEEVRKLAEESQGAAGQIAALIDEIQRETARAVEVVERDGASARRTAPPRSSGPRGVRGDRRLGRGHGRARRRDRRGVEGSASAAQMPRTSSPGRGVAEESSASTEQVSASTQQTSASAQEIASSGAEALGHRRRLERLVGSFRLLIAACLRRGGKLPRAVAPERDDGPMIFRQITHDDLGCASYLVGDEDAGVAAVVDPKLDIDEYLALARYIGVRIEHILETHNHADHVSGHGRLAAATGATIHVNRLAAPDYEHQPFDDGWELALGSVVVRALHTPGHRPEHTAFALIDTTRGPEPWAVLTGDALFVGDIARPDLAVDKAEGAHGIFHSLREKLLSLPGE